MLFYRALLTALVLYSITSLAQESPWEGALFDGSQIAIDPVTNKATRTWNGESTQLWDGVHQLDNDAVIIVRDGIVVKDATVMNIQQEQQLQQMQDACMNLVRKVCGPRNECESQPACDPARQLLVMEDEERRNTWGSGAQEVSRHCTKAMSDETFFQACTKRGAGTPLSPCEKLQQRVCGSNNQCGDSDACNAANQLIKMEREDRYAPPTGQTYASGQCSEVLNDEGFFHSCK